MTQVQFWNWLDWILALIVLFSVLSGASEGFVRGLIGLASLVVGLAVAAGGYHGLGNALQSFIHSPDAAYAVAFFALFILVLVIGGVISSLAARLVKAAGMRWLDRLLGLAFGAVRGLIADAIIVMAMLAFSLAPQALKDSKLAPVVTGSARAMALMMPSDLRSHFDAGLQDLERGLIRTEKRGEEKKSPGK